MDCRMIKATRRTEMKFCKNCREKLEDSQKFCENCGAKVTNSGVEQTSNDESTVNPSDSTIRNNQPDTGSASNATNKQVAANHQPFSKKMIVGAGALVVLLGGIIFGYQKAEDYYSLENQVDRYIKTLHREITLKSLLYFLLQKKDLRSQKNRLRLMQKTFF